MQFKLNTKDYTRTSNGNKETVKAVVSVSLNVASHPEGKTRKEEAEKRETAAGLIVAELAARHGLGDLIQSEAIRALVELDSASALTPSDSAALFRVCDLLIGANKFRTVTLSGSALSLALQGVGPNARFVTNALRKAVRGYLLLDNLD